MSSDLLNKLLNHGDNIIWIVIIIFIWKNPNIIQRVSELIKQLSAYKKQRHKEKIEIYRLKKDRLDEIHQKQKKLLSEE